VSKSLDRTEVLRDRTQTEQHRRVNTQIRVRYRPRVNGLIGNGLGHGVTF